MYKKFIEYAKRHNENILTAFITEGMCEGSLTENMTNIVCGNSVNSAVKNTPKATTIFNDLLATYSTPL